MNLQSLSNRVLDVSLEKLNFVGPIDNLFDVPVESFDSSLTRLHQFDPLLQKHAPFASLFAEDFLNNNTSNLVVDEIAAINLYTREWNPSIYRLLNIALRKEDRGDLKIWFPYLRLLISGLLKLDPFSGILWRGVKDLNLASKYKKGNKIFWWGISSCTVETSVLNNQLFLGQNGNRTLFHIECTSGVDIQKYSSLPNEAEVILLPGTYFQVCDTLDLGNGLIMVNLKQIQPPVPIFDIPDNLKSKSISLFLNQDLENLQKQLQKQKKDFEIKLNENIKQISQDKEILEGKLHEKENEIKQINKEKEKIRE